MKGWHPYGAAIVGQEEADRIRTEQKEGIVLYGPAVTGKQDVKSAGPPVSGSQPKKVVRLAPGDEVAETDASLSLKDLGKVLEKSPHLLERQIDAEFTRAEGPRKGALRLFIQYETLRDGGPRDEVLAILENALMAEQ
jgi:hypothetical protein